MTDDEVTDAIMGLLATARRVWAEMTPEQRSDQERAARNGYVWVEIFAGGELILPKMTVT